VVLDVARPAVMLRVDVLFSPIRTAIRSRGLDERLVAAHLAALSKGPLTEVASSDQHTVKPWFAGKVDFSPKVKDLAAEGFPLAGGRVDRISGRPAAALVYGRAKHLVDLFVWIDSAPAAGIATARARGINVVRWTEGDLAYAAVSDLNETELLAFSDLVRR
jgi:anti-sigma factor RsiW